MSIIIGADFVPTNNNQLFFSIGEMNKVVDDGIIEILSAVDFRVFNLEVPLTDALNPINKCGPCLSAPTWCVNGYKKLEIDLFTLANNHIYDQGDRGIESTISTLKSNKIEYTGVGKTIDEARVPFIKEIKGKTVGIYSCAEHEFSIVNDEHSGANPYNPIETFDHISDLKDRCDYVIVLYHGGKEEYRFPSPDLKRTFRKMADKGADLVIAQHTHCIGCMENYHNSILIYGQGNFLFDDKTNEYWNTGLLVKINDDFSISYIPVLKDGYKVILAQEERALRILNEFYERSKIVLNDHELKTKYIELAKEEELNLLLTVSGLRFNIPFRGLLKIIGKDRGIKLIKLRYGKKGLLSLKNRLECEAYRELLIDAINHLIEND